MYQRYKMKEKEDKFGQNEGLHLENEALSGNPFSVPQGYFEELEAKTLFLSRLGSVGDSGLTVPSGYFEQLEDDILCRTREEKLKQLVSGDVDQWVSGDGFGVPTGYFETLQEQILSGIKPQKPKETIVRKLVGSAAIKYAAAACVLFVSIFMIKDSVLQSGNPLADIPEQELIQYLQLYGNTQDGMIFREHANMDRNLSDLGSEISSNDIEWYLDNTW